MTINQQYKSVSAEIDNMLAEISTAKAFHERHFDGTNPTYLDDLKELRDSLEGVILLLSAEHKSG